MPVPQLQIRRDGGGEGQRHERIMGMRVFRRQRRGAVAPGRDSAGRDMRVFGQEERFKPALLQRRRKLTNVDGVIRIENKDAGFHG